MPYHGLRWLKIWLHRHLLERWVSLFICPSRALHQGMQRFWPDVHSVYLPNFVSEVESRSPISDRFSLLYVGRLSREKGVADLLEAMPGILARHPRATLTVAGDGPENAKLRQLASHLGIDRNVSFLGEVGQSELAERYNSSSLCIMPSLWMENCPMTGLEALSHGRVLVAYDRGGLSDLIRNGETGILVPPGDIKELGDQISRLLGDGDLLDRLGRNAYSHYLQRFSPEGHLQQLAVIYRRAEEKQRISKNRSSRTPR